MKTRKKGALICLSLVLLLGLGCLAGFWTGHLSFDKEGLAFQRRANVFARHYGELSSLSRSDAEKLAVDFVKHYFSEGACPSAPYQNCSDTMNTYLVLREEIKQAHPEQRITLKDFSVREFAAKPENKGYHIYLSTMETYHENQEVEQNYQLYLEPVGNKWLITKACSNDNLGIHFLQPSEKLKLNTHDFFHYPLKRFEEDVRSALENKQLLFSYYAQRAQ